MDDFIVNEKIFEEALKILNKVLQRCKHHRFPLNHENYFLMMTQGIVLGHHIYKEKIKADPKKVEVIQQIEIPKTQIDVKGFLGHADTIEDSLKDLVELLILDIVAARI